MTNKKIENQNREPRRVHGHAPHAVHGSKVKRPWICVGLGNPGLRYKHTRHNVGQLAQEYLKSTSLGLRLTRPVEFIELDCFMNESGRFMVRALRRARATPQDLVVLHDDVDLPIGEVRVEFGRGAAGHHGIESLINALQTCDFWRVRIGVWPYAKQKDTSLTRALVLKPFSKTERDLLKRDVFPKLAEKLLESLA